MTGPDELASIKLSAMMRVIEDTVADMKATYYKEQTGEAISVKLLNDLHDSESRQVHKLFDNIHYELRVLKQHYAVPVQSRSVRRYLFIKAVFLRQELTDFMEQITNYFENMSVNQKREIEERLALITTYLNQIIAICEDR